MEGLVTSSQAIETRLFSPPEIERLPMKRTRSQWGKEEIQMDEWQRSVHATVNKPIRQTDRIIEIAITHHYRQSSCP